MAEKRNVVHSVDSGSFQTRVGQAGGKLVVVHFHADWSLPSKNMLPTCQALAEVHEDVLFMKVNVDDCEELAKTNNITVTPSFLFLKGGDVVEIITGANEDRLEMLIRKLKK